MKNSTTSVALTTAIAWPAMMCTTPLSGNSEMPTVNTVSSMSTTSTTA